MRGEGQGSVGILTTGTVIGSAFDQEGNTCAIGSFDFTSQLHI